LFEFFKRKSPAKLTLAGQEESWEWRGHKIVYSVLGQGAPLILQHGINAAAWAFEMRKNLEALAGQYRVYAPDLPGFGRSERKPIRYTAEMYIEFQADFGRYVAEREGQAPAVIATSLSAAHLIGAVGRNPEIFGPLILITPTGLERLNFPPSEKSERVYKILRGPVGSALFWLLTTRPSTRIFLGRDGYYDPKYIDEELLAGYRDSARQPNAKYGPLAFITFLLNHSVQNEWPAIKPPVLLVWGRESKITPLDNAQLFLKERPGTELVVIDHARLAVNDEQAAEFNTLALDWLSKHLQPAATPGKSRVA
jgi:pimeloyl-ACP methyl ester carboxylesterase